MSKEIAGRSNPNGNRTRVTYGAGPSAVVVDATYDAQDRLLTHGDYRYTWTANGDLATRTHQPTNTTLTTVYDSFGNLQQATLPDGRVLDYTTDGRHRRVQKKLNGVVVAQYLYLNQLEPIAVLDAAGAIVASFVYADRPNTPSLMYRGGRTYRLVADQVGSIRLVIDVADGAIAQRIDYDEFGRILADTNPGFQPFGFAGGLLDRDTGFVRFGARDYDPVTGRWTAKDPAGFDGGENLYVYGDGDPVNMIDVTGETPAFLALPLMSYARCFASCAALEGITSAATSDCGIDLPSLTADCATSCANPFNWLKIDRAKAITARYKRPSGSTTAAQRQSVQGKPCVKCGSETPRQVAGHNKALVEEYYETGRIDKDRMRSIDAVRPECPTCSAKEGAEMSQYSRRMREEFGL